MRKRKLTQNFAAYQAPPDTVSVSGSDFAHTLSKFASDHLAGALEIEIVGESDGIISVSPSATAHLINSLISYAKPDELMRMKIYVLDKLNIEIIFESQPDMDKLAKILTFATSCGFVVQRSSDSITFTTEINRSEIFKIYALSIDVFEKELENALLSND